MCKACGCQTKPEEGEQQDEQKDTNEEQEELQGAQPK
jgi:hypothetical protein